MKNTYLLILLIFVFEGITSAQQLESFTPADVHQISWSMCSGADGTDKINDIITDNDKSIYVTGFTTSGINAEWPLLNTFSGGHSDAFINKISPEGEILWSLLIGGEGDDTGTAVTVDSDGNIYIAGQTNSISNISYNNNQSFHGGINDAFITKVTPDGTMVWNRYYGGNGEDAIKSISAGPEGRIAFCGMTASDDMGTISATQSFYAGGLNDGFLGCLDAVGDQEWFSYFGGSANDEINDITFDNVGNTYIAGAGSLIYVVDMFSALPFAGGSEDGIAAAFDASGNLLWANYVGGNGSDVLNGITISSSGKVLLAGSSNSGSMDLFPNVYNVQAGNQEALILSFSNSGIFNWAQYFGGSAADAANDIQIDFFDNVYVAGETNSNDVTMYDSFQTINRGGTDNFLIKMTPTGTKLWASYAGGSSDESLARITTDRKGKIYLTGSTKSSDLLLTLPANAYNNSEDGYILKISDCNNPDVEIHTPDELAFCDGEEALLIACGALHYEWSNGDTTVVSTADSAKTYYVNGYNHAGCSSRSNPMKFDVLETPTVIATPGGPTIFCGEGSVSLYAVGADSIRWNNGATGSVVLADTNRVFIAIGIGENGCRSTSEPIEIVFLDLPIVQMAIVEDTVCVSDSPIPMIVIPQGGTFIGQGTENYGYFNPFTAGGGQHDLYYTYTDENGCTTTTPSVSTYVMSFPTVIFDTMDTMCVYDPSIELFGSPVGGFFEGDGVVGNVFTPAQSGNGPQNIIYSYIDSNGCTNVDSHVIQVESCMGIEDLQEDAMLIYPNPASDYLRVQWSGNASINANVYDLSGALIQSIKVVGQTSVDTSVLPDGIYQLVIYNGQVNQTKKFSVIH